MRLGPLPLLAALLAVVSGAASGCFDAKVADDDVERIRSAIEREVPQARIVTLRVGDPVEQCCGVHISVSTEPSDPAHARRISREVSRVAWRNAPEADIYLEVSNFVGGPDCQPRNRTECWVDELDISWADGGWLWAPDGDPRHRPAPAPEHSRGRSCHGGPDLVAPGFTLDPLYGFQPTLNASAAGDEAFDETRLRQGADGIAAFVWACYPAPLRSLNLTVRARPGGASAPSGSAAAERTYRFTAAELRERLGPRPQGLPE